MAIPLNPLITGALSTITGAVSHDRAESYDTGYVDTTTGLLNPDAQYGLQAPYIWVHYPLLRASTVAKNLAVPVQPGIPVLCAINRETQELDVIGIDPVRGPAQLGGAVAASLNRPSTGASVNTDLLPGKNYMPGGVYPDTSIGGMNVWVNDYPPINFVGTAYDLTGDEPGVAAEFAWAVFYLLDGNATPQVATSPATVVYSAAQLLISDALAVPMPAGAYRLFCVSVSNGQTDVRLSRFEDLRDFNTAQDAGGQWIVDYASVVPAGCTGGLVPRGIRITPSGSLSILGSVYVV